MGEAAGLDWAQTEGLAHAYATDSAYLIQGPPGTGKTRVLAKLVEALVEDGERVFVTAFTHRAINNALNAINQVAPLTSAVKIGEPSRADDLEVENCLSFGGSPMSSMGRGYAIGATPFSTRTKRLDGVEFDTVIFDEASQITLPLAVMGMLPARKFIFIGDHQQLPPVLQSVSPAEAAQKSIFGHLVGRGFDTLLETTYRLNNDLVRWPSKQFYGGRVRPADGVGDRVLALNSAPSRFKDVLEPKRVKVFIDLGHRNTRTRSRAEAGVIVDLIKEAVQCGVEPRENRSGHPLPGRKRGDPQSVEARRRRSPAGQQGRGGHG